MSEIDYSEPITETRDVNTDEYRIRKLEVNNAVLNEKIKNLETSISRLTESVDALTDALTQAKGGWKSMVVLGTVLSGVVATVVGIIEWVRG